MHEERSKLDPILEHLTGKLRSPRVRKIERKA